MKYQFNEQELLSLFYDKENDMRPDMAAPYLKNGYVCATEAHILIRIKAETLNGKYNEIEGLNIDFPADNCNFIRPARHQNCDSKHSPSRGKGKGRQEYRM